MLVVESGVGLSNLWVSGENLLWGKDLDLLGLWGGLLVFDDSDWGGWLLRHLDLEKSLVLDLDEVLLVSVEFVTLHLDLEAHVNISLLTIGEEVVLLWLLGHLDIKESLVRVQLDEASGGWVGTNSEWWLVVEWWSISGNGGDEESNDEFHF